MNLTDMRTLVRRDLRDEEVNSYRWTDAEIDRQIAHALKDFSEALPLEQKATLATTSGSREISLSLITDRIRVEAVEYPLGQFPPSFPRFALWNETLILLGEGLPDGSDCAIYYGKLHTLDTGSTLPSKYEDLVATGACGYAAIAWAGYAINRVNLGGDGTPGAYQSWGQEKLAFFRAELKRLGQRNTLRVRQLYIAKS